MRIINSVGSWNLGTACQVNENALYELIVFSARILNGHRCPTQIENTPVADSTKCLISFLAALPEPVILPDAAALLADAILIEDQDYQMMSIRSIVQSTLPYNHRVLLQVSE